MFYKLNFFKKCESLCGDDFQNKIKIDTINLHLLSSLSELMPFKLPFSGKDMGYFAVLKMNNGDIYYIKKDSFDDIIDVINKINSLNYL